MIYNNQAEELFAEFNINSIKADDRYMISEKTDNCGRKYYDISSFQNTDNDISSDTDLSQLEWNINEVHIGFSISDLLEVKYIEALSIFKSWISQLKRYSDSKFCIMLSYDNGDLMDEEDRTYSFTLRFWKERCDTALISSINDFSQPVIIEHCNYFFLVSVCLIVNIREEHAPPLR